MQAGEIWRIMHELPWITIFLSLVRRFGNDFHSWRITIFLSLVRRFGDDFHEWRSHEWKSLPNRLTSDKKIVIHGNECIILFLTRYFTSWTHKSAKNYHRALIRNCCQGRPFPTEHCDVTTIDLWRHANAKYWYCDVIFVYCHCTRKLAQRRSSLVNNSREYRYLATRYSRLSV